MVCEGRGYALPHLEKLHSGSSINVVAGLMFTLGTLVQVGAYPKKMENAPKKPLYILLLGH